MMNNIELRNCVDSVNLDGYKLAQKYSFIFQLANNRMIKAEDYYIQQQRSIKQLNKTNKKQALEREKSRIAKLNREHQTQYDGIWNYRFYDENGTIIYVGYTNRLVRRLTNEHFTKRGHLPQECYNRVVKIEITKFKNQAEGRLAEDYYINTYKPEYNDQHKWDGQVSFPIAYLDNKEWTEFKVSDLTPYKFKPSSVQYNEIPLPVKDEVMNKWFKEHPCKVNYKNIYLRSIEAQYPIEDFEDDPEELQWREEQIDYLMKPAKRSGVIW